MFALVLFSDGIYDICKNKNVSFKGEDCVIRYKGSRYTGTVVAVNAEKSVLETLKSKLENDADEDTLPEKPIPEKETERTLEKHGIDAHADLPPEDPNNLEVRDELAVNKTLGPEELVDCASIRARESAQVPDIDDHADLPGEDPNDFEVRADERAVEETLRPVEIIDCTSLCVREPAREPDIDVRIYSSVESALDPNSPMKNTKSGEASNASMPGLDTFIIESNLNENATYLGNFTEFTNENAWIWKDDTLTVYHSDVSFGDEKNNEGATKELPSFNDPPSKNLVPNDLPPTDAPPNDPLPNDFFEMSETTPAIIGANNADTNISCCGSSGSFYVPDSDCSDEEDVMTNTAEEQQASAGNASTDLDASLIVNKIGHIAPDDVDMFVKTVESGTKKDFCIYCKKEQGKLSRHVARQHKNEEDVARYLSFEKGSDERKIIMATIRKNGQFFFNSNHVINTGERRVVRRPNAEFCKTATDFATCPSCRGDYSKNSLRHHYRRCAKKNSANRRDILKGSKKLIGRIHPQACNILRKRVFPTMQEDDVAKAIRYDELIILFGNKLCEKYKDPHYYDMVRQRLRQLGRFLIEIRTRAKDVHNFFSVLYPKNYDASIRAIQSLAGLNKSGRGFDAPSLATSLGSLLKQIGKLAVSEWIKRQNKEKQTYVEDFLTLLINDFSTSIGRTALETQAQKKRQVKVILPSKADIQKLQIHLRQAVKKNYEELNAKFSHQAWMELAEATLISIQLFNRRRAGEIERIFIDDFLSRQKIDETTVGDAYLKFTPAEKQTAQKYNRFTIRGKLNRTVPVLLHTDILACCNLLLKYRVAMGVHKKNPYLFGIPGTLKGDYKYLRACELMRKFAQACGAEKPQTLRGTVLRKHIATMCVHFNLNDNEVSDLANFLGHADKIHKEHYRQPIISREILKISKLLEAVQGKVDSDGSEEEPDDHNVGSHTVTYEPMEVTPPTEPSLDPRDSSYGDQDATDDESFEAPKVKRKRSTSPYGQIRRIRWTPTECKIIREAFGDAIAKKTGLPSLAAISEVLRANPGVFNRNAATIKTWIFNERKKGK